MIDPIEQEIQYTKSKFNLDEVLEFQKTHDVQIIREADYSYHVWIDKKAYGTSLTPICALIIGIEQFKKIENN